MEVFPAIVESMQSVSLPGITGHIWVGMSLLLQRRNWEAFTVKLRSFTGISVKREAKIRSPASLADQLLLKN